jgi:hypothetical protein
MTVWTDINLKEYEMHEIGNSYLLNILKFIERKSNKGILSVTGGCGSEAEDMWAYEEILEGEEVLNLYNYNLFVKEAIKRKLI